MFDNSVVKKSGQWWKLNLAFWGEIIGSVIMFIGIGYANETPIAANIALSGMAIGILSIIFACTAIRCPNCKAPWLWMGVSGKSSKEWLHWLLSQSQCPKCEK